MKTVDFNQMRIVKNYSSKSEKFEESEFAGNCYDCDYSPGKEMSSQD